MNDWSNERMHATCHLIFTIRSVVRVAMWLIFCSFRPSRNASDSQHYAAYCLFSNRILDLKSTGQSSRPNDFRSYQWSVGLSEADCACERTYRVSKITWWSCLVNLVTSTSAVDLIGRSTSTMVVLALCQFVYSVSPWSAGEYFHCLSMNCMVSWTLVRRVCLRSIICLTFQRRSTDTHSLTHYVNTIATCTICFRSFYWSD